MKTKSHSNYFKFVLLAIVLLSGIFFGYRYFGGKIGNNSEVQILKFDRDRDSDFIIESFAKDWYWLTNNPDFSPQFMMDNMSPRQDPHYFGKQNIIVLHVKGQPVGFGAYFMRTFYEGKVHFLDIRKEFRGHGYSKVLMKYMVDALFDMGAKVVKLDTRINNKPARALYNKLGFREIGESDGFVHFEMKR